MSCTYPIFSSTIGRWQANEKLKTKKRTPLGVSGIILELIRDHFRHNSTQFKYVDDDEVASKLEIELHELWDPKSPSNYPGIYVKRDSWQLRAEGKVMGDLKANMICDDPKSVEFWVPITTSYSLMVIGKQYGQIERLVEELYTYLLFFGYYIRDTLDFHRFEVTNVGGVSLLQEPREFRICQMNLIITFDLIWRVGLEKPIIENVNVSLTDC